MPLSMKFSELCKIVGLKKESEIITQQLKSVLNHNTVDFDVEVGVVKQGKEAHAEYLWKKHIPEWIDKKLNP